MNCGQRILLSLREAGENCRSRFPRQEIRTTGEDRINEIVSSSLSGGRSEPFASAILQRASSMGQVSVPIHLFGDSQRPVFLSNSRLGYCSPPQKHCCIRKRPHFSRS